MNKEALEKRLAELHKMLEQIQANGNATLGAIGECEYWLKQLEKEVNLETISDSGQRPEDEK
ncbi:MAG: hypothetical protein NUV80_07560 [Candidatus Berkelbacteria bacterium]|nr:hypothetical protein [Candidatus Berkelbacteria bacterium]